MPILGDTMSIAETLKAFIGVGDSGVSFTSYRCDECGHVFESAKDPDRVQCTECLSRDVNQA